jgi:two-component system sensor histidine kinase/response regulator
MKCLLVDDLEENLLALSALLREKDVEILLARSGSEALELLLVHEVALAFLDVQMPEMDGFELAELMRGAERTRDVPIIFVTAGGRDQHRLFKGYELGAVDFLYKPIEPHVLQSKANVFFQLYRQREQLTAQLQESTETLRMNEMFMAILSHDLRNPLNAILTGAELLLRTTHEESSRKVASRVRSSGKRMSGMIEDMLDLARARLGNGISLGVQPLDLSELVQRVVLELQAAFPGSALEVSEAGDLRGAWDPSRLAQVVSNLVGNALEHGEGSGPIEIRLDGTEPDEVRLSVSNAGGMPASVRGRLFDPFRGRDANGSPERGLGLGLYIVQQVALSHGGSVEVQSEESRTTFFVHLPRKTATTSRR